MAIYNEIINVLRNTDVSNMPRLIEHMSGQRGFFWVHSSGHDHWTNGTAQHSFRVYQYMNFFYEHPEEIPCNRKSDKKADPALAPVKVKQLSKQDVILTGLLHDVGKMHGCNHHASKSKNIIDKYLGRGFSEKHPQVLAAIFFHHTAKKNGGALNKYSNSTLKKLLNLADSMASGTTWNSTRFKGQRSQHNGRVSDDIKHLRRVAMDRTRQMLDYRIYLDYHYYLCHVIGYGSRNIVWNSHGNIVSQIKSGKIQGLPIPNGKDFITTFHEKQETGKFCLAVGIDLSVIAPNTRKLRQDNPQEEELLICSNILLAFYQSQNIGKHRYAYTMRPETAQNYQKQSKEKGIYLPDVTFIRDGVSEGFRQVTPWTTDLLLIPDWKGVSIIGSTYLHP